MKLFVCDTPQRTKIALYSPPPSRVKLIIPRIYSSANPTPPSRLSYIYPKTKSTYYTHVHPHHRMRTENSRMMDSSSRVHTHAHPFHVTHTHRHPFRAYRSPARELHSSSAYKYDNYRFVERPDN